MGYAIADRDPADRGRSRPRPSGGGAGPAAKDAKVQAALSPHRSVVRRQELDRGGPAGADHGIGPEEAASADDRTMAEKTEDVESAVAEVADLLAGLDVLDEEIRAALSEIMDDYELVGLEVADDSGSWQVSASINPKARKTVAKGGRRAKGGKGGNAKAGTVDFKKKRAPAKKSAAEKVVDRQLELKYGKNAVRYKKRSRRKLRKASLPRGTISPSFTADDDYSDSEDESTPYNQSHGGDVRNVTKNFGVRTRPKQKIDNTVASAQVAAAIAVLERDAHAIHDLIPKGSRSFGATTILTAVVSRKDGRGYRRFVFCNVDGNLAPAMRDRAEALGYHVIAAAQAHAEGQMIQYLKSREGLYDLHNMGCDKDHCAECEWAMNAYLKTVTTTGQFSGKVFKNWYLPPPLISALGRTDASTNKRSRDGVRL